LYISLVSIAYSIVFSTPPSFHIIDIYYSRVGIISVLANEYDFEKEFQNILKNNRKTA
jgi:hypothetical protein